MAGLEPADAGVKVPCLTTWRHPSIRRFSGKKARDWDHLPIPCFLGWVKGLEPSTPGTTIRCSNQLSYTHQIHGVLRPTGARRKIGTPEGTRTPGLLLRRQLLYPTELLAHIGAGDENRTRIPSLEGWCPGHCATPAYRAICSLPSQQIVSLDIIAWLPVFVNILLKNSLKFFHPSPAEGLFPGQTAPEPAALPPLCGQRGGYKANPVRPPLSRGYGPH